MEFITIKFIIVYDGNTIYNDTAATGTWELVEPLWNELTTMKTATDQHTIPRNSTQTLATFMMILTKDGNRANGEQKQNQASDLTEDETTQIPPAR